MGYSQLTYREREFLMILKGHGHSIRKIAEALHRSPSTVSRELERNSLHGEYNAITANRLSQARKRWGGHFRNGEHSQWFKDLRSRWFQFRKLPRTHIAWRSDLNEYFRHRSEPIHFLMNILYPRSRSLFKRKDKPWHFLQMNELAELLMEKLDEEKKATLTRQKRVVSIGEYHRRHKGKPLSQKRNPIFPQTFEKLHDYNLASTG
ncbi:hypothetical protein FUAX_08970 [Fulvitalea axinellae]|uniref:Transposase IS30-like HTH domain-containing protein n=1 Tax=Fulvitalea axinellae TaxID=1182444 RepID=A0AAU9CGW1_9BACT|nr:hypothetical protein FUAX_08970 [Fulvitalea axinellae]